MKKYAVLFDLNAFFSAHPFLSGIITNHQPWWFVLETLLSIAKYTILRQLFYKKQHYNLKQTLYLIAIYFLKYFGFVCLCGHSNSEDKTCTFFFQLLSATGPCNIYLVLGIV